MRIIIICRGSGFALIHHAKMTAERCIYLESIPQPGVKEDKRQITPSR